MTKHSLFAWSTWTISIIVLSSGIAWLFFPSFQHSVSKQASPILESEKIPAVSLPSPSKSVDSPPVITDSKNSTDPSRMYGQYPMYGMGMMGGMGGMYGMGQYPMYGMGMMGGMGGMYGMGQYHMYGMGMNNNIPQANIQFSKQPLNRENYAHVQDNPIKKASEFPVSTLSIDVDTGSYANVRRMINAGQLPPHDAVRLEEMINYFSYDYPLPDTLEPPFKVTTEIATTPWNKNTLLLLIGIKGYDIPKDKLPPANLVFLIDVSGSMQSPDKLDLIKSSLKLFTHQLTEKDKVTLVVYAGASGLVLEPTSGDQTSKIKLALEQLSAGGSTHGSEGIQLAYAMAEQAFIKGGINRVLLATDGDFNVGITNIEELKNLIEQKRRKGISLTTLGVGTNNYNDALMEQLADVGNGNYSYIDTLNEAQKVLVEQMSSTLQTIAKDVKVQIEFNPLEVAEYRLLGYENRVLQREDFSNDQVDAGEIGAGHSVTALYEITLVDNSGQRLEKRLDQTPGSSSPSLQHSDKLAFLRIRYKAPEGNTSQLLEWPIKSQEKTDSPSERFRFAAAVAAWGQYLRSGKYLEKFSYDDLLELARHAKGEDPFGYRAEFIKLVSLAKSLELSGMKPSQHPTYRTGQSTY